MLFVEAEDAGTLLAEREWTGCRVRADAELASACAGNGTAGSRVVQEVHGPGFGAAGEFEPKKSAQFDAAEEASIEPLAAAADGFEAFAGGWMAPDFFGRDAAGIAA